MRTITFFSIILISLFGCKSGIENQKEMENPNIIRDISYLALGDSYTIGEGVSASERFPSIIAESLKEKHNFVTEVEVIATTGWRTDELITAIQSADLQRGNYDFITLLIGVNNQYQGAAFEKFEKELDSLIQMSIELLEGKKENLILISIPDYGVTPFASSRNVEKIKQEIDQYNNLKQTFANKYGLPYVYITDLTRAAKSDLSLLADDQLHPSGKLYREWVLRIFPEIEMILGI